MEIKFHFFSPIPAPEYLTSLEDAADEWERYLTDPTVVDFEVVFVNEEELPSGVPASSNISIMVYASDEYVDVLTNEGGDPLAVGGTPAELLGLLKEDPTSPESVDNLPDELRGMIFRTPRSFFPANTPLVAPELIRSDRLVPSRPEAFFISTGNLKALIHDWVNPEALEEPETLFCDGIIFLSVDASWEFDSGNFPDLTSLNLHRVLLHELGHLLGVDSGLSQGTSGVFSKNPLDELRDLNPSLVLPLPVAVMPMDLFRFHPDDRPQSVSEFRSKPRLFAWGPVPAQPHLFVTVDPQSEIIQFGLSTGPTSLGGNGFQTPHWHPPSVFFLPKTGIMDPLAQNSFGLTTITEADLTIMDAIGWDVDYEGKGAVNPEIAFGSNEGVLILKWPEKASEYSLEF
ncbi:MAG TPA: hypothetical protein EYQ50_17195, partial [Verrucomicrobiales bacterium]|nr:hypothetical protein [Verrucomicrobiales bacterium]